MARVEVDVFKIPKEDDFQSRIYNQSTKMLLDTDVSNIYHLCILSYKALACALPPNQGVNQGKGRPGTQQTGGPLQGRRKGVPNASP